MRQCVLPFLIALLPPVQAAAETFTVTMAGSSYHPAHLEIAVGDTIRFVNDDLVGHNVFTPTTGHAADLGLQEPGAPADMSFRKVGRIDIECVIHPDMLLVVEVR